MKLHIADMLRLQSAEHLSFHTPGHKHAGADITELSYSDNLASPMGVLKQAEEDVAQILGADRSFLLTDGSTSGVYSMLYTIKVGGMSAVAVPKYAHPSVFRGCKLMGLTPVCMHQEVEYGIPLQPSVEEMANALKRADALLLTSPDYYGFLPNLLEARRLAGEKPLLIDGAHGSHLHFCGNYAGRFADLWVDGVHKSLPALTQGAVVSAKGKWADQLFGSVKYFRTTSPSYPILASVEYAVKYPRNLEIERAAEAFKREFSLLKNDDWSKLVVPFGKNCGVAQAALERAEVYPEFNDGNYLMFYLSPKTREEDLSRLGAMLKTLERGIVEKSAPAGAIPIYSEEP